MLSSLFNITFPSLTEIHFLPSCVFRECSRDDAHPLVRPRPAADAERAGRLQLDEDRGGQVAHLPQHRRGTCHCHSPTTASSRYVSRCGGSSDRSFIGWTHWAISRSKGARCSSVVRAFAHGAMGRQIDPSWGGPIELFLIPRSEM